MSDILQVCAANAKIKAYATGGPCESKRPAQHSFMITEAPDSNIAIITP